VRKTIATATVWAIVLDIDETSLSNWERIVHNSFAHVPSGNCDLKSAIGVRAARLGAERAVDRHQAHARAFQFWRKN
jgi:hypothetical protein